MDLNAMKKKLKDKAQGRAGMILIHNGVVRASSRDGSPCSSIEVSVDYDKLAEIMEETRAMPGIYAAEVEINQGKLEVGDDVMLLGVAGDFRENVLSALTSCLNRIKSEVTSKKEWK